MARRSQSAELGLVALTIEGGLIAPEQVQKIIAADRTAKTAESYGCPKGTGLGDEIARYFRIGQAIWRDYDKAEGKTITRTAAFAHDLLSQCLGFTDLAGPVEHQDGTRRYRLAWEGKGGRVPVVVAAPVPDGDAFARSQPEFGDGDGGRPKRSPAALLQDWLNGTDHALWGLVFAGDRVRLMRDNASLTRPAWLEADLGAMFRDEMFADFTAFWLLAHATRFGAETAAVSDCALEQWREAGLKQGVEARKDLYANVATALEELGQGLVSANPDLRERLQSGALPMQALFEELLRTVYRLIFLAVAEDRDLLHPRSATKDARALYSAGYSFSFWRERSRRRVARDAHNDAWEAMKVTLAALEQGEDMLGLPALGGLFARSSTPNLNAATIPNRAFLSALFCLGFIRKDGITHRINWRDLKTEELGSVYEGLLEIRPSLSAAGEFQLGTGAKGNDRKTSGSYYTPDSLVECLLDSALNPVLDRAEASGATADEKIKAILALKVIDPACGSGHFLLGAARRMADRVARLRNEDAGKEETQAALRDVVSRCIHGVDRNPMAVELAKVALWIESVSPGQPLGFLDANLRCGDALLGVFDLSVLEAGIPDEAYKPLTCDSKDAAKFYLKQNRDAKKGQGQLDFLGGGGVMPAKPIAAGLGRIKAMPEDTVGQVEKKKAAFEAWNTDPARWNTAVACDLYMAAFLLPKTEVPASHLRGLVPTTADVRQKLAGGNVYGPLQAAGVDAARAASVLHWPLEFPDVMVASGGFDVVLGNPPYGAEVEPAAKIAINVTHPLSKAASNTGADFVSLAKKILRADGQMGLVIPKSYTYSYAWSELRNCLINETVAVLDVGEFWPDVLLEQIVFVGKSNALGQMDDDILVKTFAEGVEAPFRAIPKSLAIRFGSIPTGISEADWSIIRHLARRDVAHLGEHTTTKRGAGLQRFVAKQGAVPVIRGKDIASFRCANSEVFLEDSVPREKIVWARRGDAVFQNIVAHLTKPTGHIKLIGAVSNQDVAALDTVNIITSEAPEVTGYALSAYLMSNFVNWYVYVCIYNRAVRTMHFDNYFLKKIPAPTNLVFNELSSLGVDLSSNPDNECSWMELNKLVYDAFALPSSSREYIDSMHKPRWI